MICLRYGDGQELRIDPPEEAAIADFSVPRGRPLADPAAAVAAALADPLDYPALQRAVTPGDRVTLAIDRGVPRLDTVVAGAVHTLLGGSVSPEDITLLLAPEEDGIRRPQPTAALPAGTAAAVRVVEHEPLAERGQRVRRIERGGAGREVAGRRRSGVVHGDIVGGGAPADRWYAHGEPLPGVP